MSFALLNQLTAKPGKRSDVVRLLLESGRSFDDNDACLLYLVTESEDDPDVIWVVDLWTNEEEHEAALQAPEMRPFVAEALPLLVGPPEQTRIDVRGGKAVPTGR